MAAASEVFRLVTGVPLDAERRIAASVDLGGGGRQALWQRAVRDSEVDAATSVIKQTLAGSLTSDGLQSILGFGN